MPGGGGMCRMDDQKLKVVVISAERMASTIDDEIRGMDIGPSLKKQLPYSHAPICKALSDLVEIIAVKLAAPIVLGGVWGV